VVLALPTQEGSQIQHHDPSAVGSPSEAGR
jgi:hypothetical protein